MSAHEFVLPDTVARVDADQYLGDFPDGLSVFDLGTSEAPPPPQEFVLEDYIPEGCVTSLYAKGGSAKSFIAMIIGFHIVLGTPVFGRKVLGGPVLYLDAELDQRTAERRAWMISRGMGLERPPAGLMYHRLSASLTQDKCNSDVLGAIRRYRPRLTIVDSFTAAVRGKDTNSLDDVTDRLTSLDNFGTVLMIDHIPKSADIGSSVTAIGSVAKQMFARSALFVASTGRASILRHEKSNFGPLAEPLRFALNFSQGFVALEAPLDPDDPRLNGIEAALPAKERIRTIIPTEYAHGVSVRELAERLDLSKSTVANSCTALKDEGLIINDRGKWRPRP